MKTNRYPYASRYAPAQPVTSHVYVAVNDDLDVIVAVDPMTLENALTDTYGGRRVSSRVTGWDKHSDGAKAARQWTLEWEDSAGYILNIYVNKENIRE